MIELAKSDTCSGGTDDAFWDRCMTCDRLLRDQPCWSWSDDPRVHLCETCAEPYVALEALRK